MGLNIPFALKETTGVVQADGTPSGEAKKEGKHGSRGRVNGIQRGPRGGGDEGGEGRGKGRGDLLVEGGGLEGLLGGQHGARHVGQEPAAPRREAGGEAGARTLP